MRRHFRHHVIRHSEHYSSTVSSAMAQSKPVDDIERTHWRGDKQLDWKRKLESTYPETSIHELVWYYTRRIEANSFLRKDVFVDLQAAVTKVTCPDSEVFYISDSLDPATLAGIIDARPSKGLDCLIHHIRFRGWDDESLPKDTPIIMWPTDVDIAPDKIKQTATVSVRSRIFYKDLQHLQLEDIRTKSVYCMKIRYELKDLEDVISILKVEYVEEEFEIVKPGELTFKFATVPGMRTPRCPLLELRVKKQSRDSATERSER
ncbi:hypothetical protein SCHPADRAFT_568119 [Schizopora paradoxa]|uniref:Uncharacterized protein n=1 Tax=Schizopora paradoxa TaxID=27342 RepID=A0A0H2RD23_9AGAM|nr:hypothetical protein SCHPADRAFT_568119 [Schizopora paradoxa]